MIIRLSYLAKKKILREANRKGLGINNYVLWLLDQELCQYSFPSYTLPPATLSTEISVEYKPILGCITIQELLNLYGLGYIRIKRKRTKKVIEETSQEKSN